MWMVVLKALGFTVGAAALGGALTWLAFKRPVAAVCVVLLGIFGALMFVFTR